MSGAELDPGRPPVDRWFPVAASGELVPRHVYHGQLLGRELAVWRADDGRVNVWENRCPHRGVRLTIGANDGAELICRYHGWRYASGTAGCTYIPAHPAEAPARSICVPTLPAVESHGLVWTCEAPPQPLEAPIALPPDDALALRPMPVGAPPSTVGARLAEALQRPIDAATRAPGANGVVARDAFVVEAAIPTADTPCPCTFLVQPVDADRAVVRGVAQASRCGPDRLAFLARLDRFLTAFRDTIERETPRDEARAARQDARITPVPLRRQDVPATGRDAGVRVTIEAIEPVAADVLALRLAPADGDRLPTFHPGAHIDVHLPDGVVRQYSITNGPGECGHYTIGVKREPDSRGGSRWLHETASVGDELAVSVPRNNFPLRRDGSRTLLVAGGIGITPLLSMARALHHAHLPFELHVFARSPAHVPFDRALEAFEACVTRHAGLDAGATAERLERILVPHPEAAQLYVCGPVPMLETTRRLAVEHGWPEAAVHFEYFENPLARHRDTGFELVLARRRTTVRVPPGRSVLEVLRDSGVAVPSSCEQGACGTCMVRVIEGPIDHQDVYLSDGERREGSRMLACVSRAASSRLVLDL